MHAPERCLREWRQRPPWRPRTRGMQVRAMLVAVLAFAVAACGNGAAGQLTVSPVASSSASAASQFPSTAPTASSTADLVMLTGTWDTGPYATKDFPGQDQAEFRVRFYEDAGTPFVTIVGWDPSRGSRPADGDHGPYRLLPGGEIEIASADQPQFFTHYRYSLNGNILTLTWLRNDPLGPDAADTSGSFGTISLHRV